MAETVYDLTDDAQVLKLWGALQSHGFHLDVEDSSPVDVDSILDALSDLDWYVYRGEPATDTTGEEGFHQVVGKWSVYLSRCGSIISLVVL